MDVLQPDLVWIDDRCYRKRGGLELTVPSDNAPVRSVSWYESMPDDDGPTSCDSAYTSRRPAECMNDEEDDNEEELIEAGAKWEEHQSSEGQKTQLVFKLSLPMASVYVKHVIGRNMETAKQLQLATRTRLSFPQRGAPGGGGNVCTFGARSSCSASFATRKNSCRYFRPVPGGHPFMWPSYSPTSSTDSTQETTHTLSRHSGHVRAGSESVRRFS